MNLKIKVNPVFPATVQGTGGIGVSKASGVWTIEPSWDDLAVETDLSDASQRQLWIFNPSSEVYTRLSVQYLLDNIPAGPEGDQGPVAGIKQTYSTTTTDSDPGAGNFRFNNATIASVTAAYLDDADADGATVSAIIDIWDDSTTTTKGTLRVEKQDDSSIWAVFTVTGSVVDGTGYRKLTLTYVAHSGTFANGDMFRIAFSRAGDKGADGAGAGDVTAASDFTADNRLVRTDRPSVDGKGVQQSGISIDDSDNMSGVAALSATTIELGSASDTTISRTGAGVIAVEGIGVALNSTSLAHTAGTIELGHASDTTLARVSAGVVSVEGTQLLNAGGNQTVTGGFALTSYSIGTVSSGTTTPAPANSNYQYYTNNGAHTLAAPSSDCAIDILVTNGASAGSITFSGFTVGSSTGSALTTTNTSKFLISIRRINSVATYNIYALQ